jgi:hypothetical protein
MELREFVNIFVDRKKLFFGVFLGFILVGLAMYRFQPGRYEAALLLNVSRTGYEKTDAYRYDQFYRLQADERFADTVVRWMAAPSVREEMISLGAPEPVVVTLSAKRLSSQMIDVRYSASSSERIRECERDNRFRVEQGNGETQCGGERPELVHGRLRRTGRVGRPGSAAYRLWRRCRCGTFLRVLDGASGEILEKIGFFSKHNSQNTKTKQNTDFKSQTPSFGGFPFVLWLTVLCLDFLCSGLCVCF